MRCIACDNILSERDMTRVGAHSGDPLELCTPCVKSIPGLEFVENPIADDDDHTDTEPEADDEAADLIGGEDYELDQ